MVWLANGEKNFDDMFSQFDRIPASAISKVGKRL